MHETLRTQTRNIGDKVDSIPADQFMASSEEDLIDHIYDQSYIEPLTLHEDSMEMEQGEAKIDVSRDHGRNPFGDPGPILVKGVRVVVSVPYTGESLLWKVRPNRFQSVFPRARVFESRGEVPGHIELEFSQPIDAPPEQLKPALDSELKSIRFYLDAQRQQIEQFNSSAKGPIRQAIKARYERLKTHEGITKLLGIPLKRAHDAPSVEPIPMRRALVRPLPPAPKSGYRPEPGITTDDYEHILSVIRHVGRTFEATPKTYAVHDEEELRDIILANLNGHYQGSATGETFRRKGKTDIHIEDHDRAAFIAECKVWRGQKELLAAVDQLLGYLTWRDCKTAVVIFNKHNAKFSEILSKIPDALRGHSNFKREIDKRLDGEWRFAFRSREDEDREIIVNVAVFDIHDA